MCRQYLRNKYRLAQAALIDSKEKAPGIGKKLPKLAQRTTGSTKKQNGGLIVNDQNASVTVFQSVGRQPARTRARRGGVCENLCASAFWSIDQKQTCINFTILDQGLALGRVIGRMVRGPGYWATMVISMLAAKIKTRIMVSWCSVLSEPRRIVLTSPLPPKPAPRLAPRV